MSEFSAFDSLFDKIDTPTKLLGTVNHIEELFLEKAEKFISNLESEIEDKKNELEKLNDYVNLKRQTVKKEIIILDED